MCRLQFSPGSQVHCSDMSHKFLFTVMPLELTVKNGLVELASAGLSAPVLFARSLPAAHSAYFAWMDTENTTLRALEHVLAWSIRVLLSGVGAPGAASSMVGCVWV